jgi:hypothetical protein
MVPDGCNLCLLFDCRVELSDGASDSEEMLAMLYSHGHYEVIFGLCVLFICASYIGVHQFTFRIIFNVHIFADF